MPPEGQLAQLRAVTSYLLPGRPRVSRPGSAMLACSPRWSQRWPRAGGSPWCFVAISMALLGFTRL
eukprot:5204320-Alexandrium_andersonii.AAC.1